MELVRAKKRIGIGVRLAVMVAALLILSSSSFTIFSLISQRREAMKMFVHGSLQMGCSLERMLRFSMLENRRDEIGSAIKQMTIENMIETVTLVTHTGEPAYSSQPGPIQSVPMDDSSCSGCHVGDGSRVLKRLPATGAVAQVEGLNVTKVSLPIYNAPECYNSTCHVHSSSETVLGVMQLDVSYAAINESLGRSHKHLIAISVAIALATALVVVELIRRWVTKPVRDLLKGTRRVADGELGHVIPVGEAELGALAQAFNKMQEDLLSSQRQLITVEKLASIGKLAASVAHEINNPLTGILTYAEDLVDEADPDDPRMTDYVVIRREAMRCREIVREMLDFSRQDKPHLRPVSMNDALSHTITFVSKQAIFRNVEIKTNLQEDLHEVIADPAQLEQVILGLLVNASEAMPEGGKIFVASASLPEAKEVEVTIRDTGPGISEENLERIFEPFFSTKGGKSLGIGLAVSWNIISQHGGRLEVDSKPDEGTTFRIVVPWGRTMPTTGAPAP